MLIFVQVYKLTGWNLSSKRTNKKQQEWREADKQDRIWSQTESEGNLEATDQKPEDQKPEFRLQSESN